MPSKLEQNNQKTKSLRGLKNALMNYGVNGVGKIPMMMTKKIQKTKPNQAQRHQMNNFY